MSELAQAKYKVQIATGTDVGRTRAQNEDALIQCDAHGFWGVSDGMGGFPRGKDASALLAKQLPESIGRLSEAVSALPAPNATQAGEQLADHIGKISDAMYEEHNSNGVMFYGATLCTVWLIGEHAVFTNIGDSRAYLLKAGEGVLRQVTRDHNLAGTLVEMGYITEEEAASHSTHAQLLRFVGMPPPAQAECFIETVAPGDRILICSDGLYGELPHATLEMLLNTHTPLETLCHNLIAQANEAGGNDNISVVLVDILPEEAQ